MQYLNKNIGLEYGTPSLKKDEMFIVSGLKFFNICLNNFVTYR